jgi:predicted CXXCH cytochrome family protein
MFTDCDSLVYGFWARMRRHSQPVLAAVVLSAIGGLCPTVQAAVQDCATCHAKESARFLATAMGKSLVPPQTLPSAKITHERSHSVITIESQKGSMVHSISENGLTARYQVQYQVGGGLMGSSFLVQIGDYLFESPASWFKSYGWDVSPGYAPAPLIDFDRPMSDVCLFCHAGAARFADADGRRLQGSLGSITCERCHGMSPEHARHPSAKNIVNPAKLAGAERDSICEQCHLEAAGRILNPGKNWNDFHPGEPAERTFATYVLTGSDTKEVIAVSQTEELAESACARKSKGKLWCGTCHDPHGATRDRQREVRVICVSCHTKLSSVAHPADQRECTSCHMPSSPTTNVTHAALTDHRILRRPLDMAQDAANRQAGTSPKLSAWREPPQEFRDRDLALGEILAAVSKNQPVLEKEGSRLLEALPQEQRDADFDVLTALEGLCLQEGKLPTALELGQRTIELRPQSARAAMNLGIVLQRSGDTAEAERQLRRAIELDASLKPAYQRLAMLYGSQRRTQEMIDTIDRFLKWNPQDIMFRSQKGQQTSSR